MARSRFSARVFLGLVAIVATMFFSAAAPATASSHYARITIHKAVCSSSTGDLYGKCHDNRLAGVPFYVAGVWRETNSNGVVTWAPGAGTKTIYEDFDAFDDYVGAYVYCSNQVTGAVLWDGLARSNGSVTITTTAGQHVICDWYNLTKK
jgi:hypothetical protein